MTLKGNQAWKSALLGSLLVAFLGFLVNTRLGEGLRNLSYDLAFLFRPQVKTDQVLILYMDDESHRQLDQPIGKAWDRTVHAQAIEALKAKGAKAVVFDVLFDEKTPHSGTNAPFAPQDEALLRAATNHSNIFFGAVIESTIFDGAVLGANYRKPFSPLLRSGLAEVAAEEKCIREHYRDNAGQEQSLAWKVAEATGPGPAPNPNAERWVNYYGPPGTIPSFSYYQAFNNTIPSAFISNRVVFIGERFGIGYTGGLGTDTFRTPFTRWHGTKSPGVEIIATTYLNLLRKEWLNELSYGCEVALFCFCGVLFVVGLQCVRPMAGALVALLAALAVAALSCWMVWRTCTWYPWLVVSAIQIPAAFGWCLLKNTERLRKEKEFLELQLAISEFAVPEKAAPLDKGGSRADTPPEAWSPLSERLTRMTAANPVGSRSPSQGINQKDVPPRIPDHHMLRVIGRGAYGVVWLARDLIGESLAIKVVYRTELENTAFSREFRGIQKFKPISRSHPGFVHVLHVGLNEEAGYFYYTMELGDDQKTGQKIDPTSYTARTLKSEVETRGRLPLGESVDLALHLTSALEYLHGQDLIHRDIKSSNIIFVKGMPKFADIGLVTTIAGPGCDVTYLGTEGYMPPEGPGSPSADIFSLGKVIYQMSTGLDVRRFPELPTCLISQVDNAPHMLRLNKIILKACENEASKRFQSAAELKSELLVLQQELTRTK